MSAQSGFTEDEVLHLITAHNWELVAAGGLYALRQKDEHHMKTVDFELGRGFAEQHMVKG